MEYRPYFINYPEEFIIIGKFGEPEYRRIPKPTATKEGIQSLYRFEVEAEDEYVVDDNKELCRRMVEKFKASECYKHKSEAEREEIIEYLLQHPYINTDYPSKK